MLTTILAFLNGSSSLEAPTGITGGAGNGITVTARIPASKIVIAVLAPNNILDMVDTVL